MHQVPIQPAVSPRATGRQVDTGALGGPDHKGVTPACLSCILVGMADKTRAGDRDERVAQLRKGVLELAILAILADGASYGGRIVERLAAQPGLTASRGTVYPLLARLKNAGALATTWHESPIGPPRKYYELTADGRTSLRELRAAWSELHQAVEALMKGVTT